jgi:microcystin-dependent protein
MSDQYIGEIRQFGFNFAPSGWFLCQGQLLSISQYQALFAVLGTTYGGNGTTNFALPNLQGRMPAHQGTGGGTTFVIGQIAGSETVTVLTANLPPHNHNVNVVGSAGNLANPSNTAYLAGTTENPVGAKVDHYSASTPTTTLAAGSVSLAGNGIPISIQQPYLVINMCIAYTGIFPSRG